MKRELKGFVVGVVLASLVVSAIPTMAEKVSKSAELIYNNIKIVIDGKQADLKDAQGNTVEPFIVEGTTYLPVRAVASALNKAVSWDGATQTVYLGKNEEVGQPSMWLKDLETFSGEPSEFIDIAKHSVGTEYYNRFLTANTGDVFQNALAYCNEASYLLNYKYSSFKGTIYVPKDGKDTEQYFRYVVIGDDEPIFISDSFTSNSFTKKFDVDVSNVAVMKIAWQMSNNNEDWTYIKDMKSKFNYQDIFIGNAGLYE